MEQENGGLQFGINFQVYNKTVKNIFKILLGFLTAQSAIPMAQWVLAYGLASLENFCEVHILGS